MTSSKPLWTPKQTAEFLGNVSIKTMRRMRPAGRMEFPGRGVRPIVLYDPDEVMKWAEERKTSKKTGSRTR